MKKISFARLCPIVFLLFLSCFVTNLSAQTPSWGAFWEGNNGDHIVMDKYVATDEVDPWYYTAARTFLRIRAWNTNRTTNNYIQLFFWIEDWDQFTTEYTDGIGPKEGNWQMNKPYVFYDGYGNPYWRLGFEKEGNIYDQLNKCVIGYDPNLDFVCAYSSYGASARNTTDTYEGDWDKSDITSFTDYSVKVAVGEGGNIYIEIGSPSQLVATIGKPYVDNSVFINLNSDADFEDNTSAENNPYMRLTGTGQGSNGKDYDIQLRLNWNHTTGTFSQSDIDFSQSYFRHNGEDIVCTAISGTITETSPGSYQMIATLTGEDGTVYSVISNYSHCPKPEEFKGGSMATFSIFNDDVIQIGTARFSTNPDLDNWYYDGVNYDSKNLNKFWVIKAQSNTQEYNYIQLYFWVDTDNELYTYKDGNKCVKPGTYHFQAPQMQSIYTYGSTTYYAWYINEQYYNKCLLGLTRDSYWGVCPYSSYLARGWSQYFDPNYNTVTNMNMATVVVKEGKGGHIYIEIWVTPNGGSTPVLAVTINEPKHAGVETYQLNVYTNGNGRVEFPTNECNYIEGEEIVITPTCEEGYEFVGWSGDCVDQIRDNGDGSYTFTMGNQDCSLTANCKEEVQTYQLNIQIEGQGAVTKNPNQSEYEAGTEIILTPNPNSDWFFDSWKGGCTGQLKDNRDGTYTFTMPEQNCTLTAVFTNTIIETVEVCDKDLPTTWRGQEITSEEQDGLKVTVYKEGSETEIEGIYQLDLRIYKTFEDLGIEDHCSDEFSDEGVAGLVVLDKYETYLVGFTGDTVFYDTVPNALGCDSITKLTLRINIAPLEYWNPGICADRMEEALANGEISFFGLPITDMSQNGEMHFETTEEGCDWTYILDLTPTPNDTVEEIVEIHSFPHTYKGQTFNSKKDTLYIKTPQKDGCNLYTKLIPDYKDTLKTEVYELACMEYTWDENGKTYTESGNDTIFLRSTDNQSDSIVVLHLTIDYPKTGIDTTATACQQFTWYGTTYTESGDYTQPLKSVSGCDSIVPLHLTIYHPQVVSEETQTACEAYEWHGQTYTQSGDYEYELPVNEHGCVDKEVLHLTIAHTPAPVDLGEIIIGIGNVFTVFEGTEYEQHFDTDGDHTATGRTYMGCDSVVTFNLTVLTQLEDNVYKTICRYDPDEYPFVWNGKEYTESGVYDYKTISISFVGVDSIAHLHLTVNEPTSSETTVAQCASYTWFGQTYYESDDYEHHLTNAAGCDSTITLHLTIYPEYKDITDGDTICPSELPYTVNGVTFTESSAYTAIDSHYKQATQAIRLQTVNGCDSVVTFTLTVQTATSETLEQTTCDNELPYQWNPTGSYTQALTESGTYNYMLKSSLGCDSIYYTMNFTVDRDYMSAQPAITLETCANDEAVMITLNSTAGTPAAYDIVFDEKAAAQGLENVSHQTIASDGIIAVPLPHNEDSTRYVRPDDYMLTLTVYDQCDRKTDYPLLFRILYPSWLIQQRWRDVMAIYNKNYNGGYDFSSIRWYKNGIEIQGKGAHNSYVQMSPVLEMATYYALVTRTDDGKALRTCDFVPNLASPYYMPDIEKIRLKQQTDSRHITIETELSGEYSVYDVTGKQVMTGYFGEMYGSPMIVFSPATADGAYILRFQATDGTRDTKKWLIR